MRPGEEAGRWAGPREAGPVPAPLAVLPRGRTLARGAPLRTPAPAQARLVVLTPGAAPADGRAAVARTADVLVAGEQDVDLATAIDILAGQGHRRILTEGGPHLLNQIIGAGLLDELCLTLSPLLTGPGAGRIVQGPVPLPAPGEPSGRPLTLAHVLTEEGHLLCRYLRPGT